MNDKNIKKALLIAAAEEYETELICEKPIEFSRYFCCRMDKLIKDPKRQTKPRYLRYLQTAASIVLIVAVLGVLLYQVPQVRAFMQRFIVEHFEVYDEFDIIADINDTELTEYAPEYMPEEYELTESLDLDGMMLLTYSKKGENDIYNDIYIEYQTMESGTFIVDNEHQTVEQIKINDFTATVYRSTSEEWCSYVIWTDDAKNIIFMIYGYIDTDELIKIANSMKEK